MGNKAGIHVLVYVSKSGILHFLDLVSKIPPAFKHPLRVSVPTSPLPSGCFCTLSPQDDMWNPWL